MTKTALAEQGSATQSVAEHARAWLDANLPDALREDRPSTRRNTVAELCDWEAKLHRAGLVGATWPKEYGGWACAPISTSAARSGAPRCPKA